MAKTSMKVRDEKRTKLNKKFGAQRKQLKVTISNPHTDDDEKMRAVAKLQSLPRDSARTRQRNRCNICGRARGFNRLTGLCRIHMRTYVMNGLVPGMRKASW